MIRSRMCVSILCAILAAAIAAALLLVPPVTLAEDDTSQPVSFINHVAPILKEHCMACHDAKKRAGKLEMTSYARLRAGGTNDDPIVPGSPDESILWQRLTVEGAKRMPPPPNDRPTAKDGSLPSEKIAVIERWIREGAKLDSELSPDADLLREMRKRWQPPMPPVQYARPVAVTALAFAPDGQRLVAGGHHELTIWSAGDGKLIGRVRTRAERAYAIAFVANSQVAVAGGRPGQEGDVRIYDLAAPAVNENGVARLDGIGDPKVLIAHLADADDCMLCLAVSADRKLLAAGGCDRQVRIWDLAPGTASAKLDHAFEIHADWVLGLAFAPDGRRLFTASRDKTAKVWDLVKKESIQSFPEHQRTVYSVAVRNDGQAGLSVGADQMLRIWSADGSAKPIKIASGHGDEIFKIVPVPNQPQFLTCAADLTVRLWAEDGAAIRTFSGLTDQVYSLAATPNGAQVAAGASNGQVRIWKLADGTAITDFNASPGYVPKAVTKK